MFFVSDTPYNRISRWCTLPSTVRVPTSTTRYESALSNQKPTLLAVFVVSYTFNYSARSVYLALRPTLAPLPSAPLFTLTLYSLSPRAYNPSSFFRATHPFPTNSIDLTVNSPQRRVKSTCFIPYLDSRVPYDPDASLQPASTIWYLLSFHWHLRRVSL